MAQFQTLEHMIVATAEGVRPPERLTVAESAERDRWLNNPGSYVGPWRNSKTPYLVEPMEVLNSRDFTAMIFAGPAQTGKTDMFLNWVTHTVNRDPADMMLVQTTMTTAREFSKSKLNKLYRDTPSVGDRRMPGRQNRNTYDATFLTGNRLTLSWPTINELSGKSIPRHWLTDLDRMPENVDDEGSPFDLTKKRGTSYGRNAMTVAESTPGFEVESPQWIASSPHEAPPTKGILSLYNRGDRRRWYWACTQCDERFEPDFKHLQYPDSRDFIEAAEAAVLACPACGFPITPTMKHDFNNAGRWVKDGQIWMPDGSIVGVARRSDIASFWLKGVCAAFASWKTLVFNHLSATEDYETTGSEQALKTTINVDQGHPYTPKATAAARLPEDLKNRRQDWGGTAAAPVVPHGVRFLIATVDVQARSFVVQIHGFGAGGDIWLVDMLKVRHSDRREANGEKSIIDPAAYPEDWHTLVEQVIEKSYPLADGSGRRMQIKLIGCDSGGREGVTANAYALWRWLRDEQGSGHHRRFLLVKGTSSKGAPRVSTTYPDANRKDSLADARGEVPVRLVHTDQVKDMASAMLGREEAGTLVDTTKWGRVNFPDWAENWLYTQLTAEIRTPKGWANTARKRNEAWDLLVYAIALAIDPLIGIEQINWAAPKGWYADWDANDLVFGETAPMPFAVVPKPAFDLAKLAEEMG